MPKKRATSKGGSSLAAQRLAAATAALEVATLTASATAAREARARETSAAAVEALVVAREDSGGGLLRLKSHGNRCRSAWTFAPGTFDNPTIVEADINVAASRLADAVRRPARSRRPRGARR